MNARVLIVEDDEVLRRSVAAELADAGFHVRAESDGRDLTAVVDAFRPDVAVLDVMLPGPSGITLSDRLRRTSSAAVLFVTARDSIDDRLAGFAAGADDYLVKPFEMAELLARIRAILRRTGALTESAIEVADLVVDEGAAEVRRSGVPIALTATELKLLVYLARNRGRVVSKTQILTQIWGYDAYDPNLVEAYISAVRRKLESAGPRLIHTVRGIGYRLSDSAPGGEAERAS